MLIKKRIKETYYSVKNGVKNLIRWAPVIWKLRDWDAEYMYLLIYQHLSHVEDCLRFNGYGANAVKKTDKIRIAKNLAKRLYDKDYLDNALIPVEAKFGEIKYRVEADEKMPMWNKVVFEETPEERKARDRAYRHSEYMEQQDRKILFDMLNKYIDRWWD